MLIRYVVTEFVKMEDVESKWPVECKDVQYYGNFPRCIECVHTVSTSVSRGATE